jgi:Holliday junction resolvase RusA-like endonuclease
MTSFEIEVFGTPIPQGSLKRTKYNIIYSNDELLKDWRARLIADLVLHMPIGWDSEAAISVVADFRFARPRSHFGKKGLRPSAPKHKTSRCDLDKLIRAVGDSLQESYTVKDDSQVIQWIATKRWIREDEKPAVHLTIINQSPK